MSYVQRRRAVARVVAAASGIGRELPRTGTIAPADAACGATTDVACTASAVGRAAVGGVFGPFARGP